MKNRDQHQKIKQFLQHEEAPVSSRWIAKQLKLTPASVRGTLRQLVKAGEVKCQLRVEFDFEYNYWFGAVACKRRRNYYWIEAKK